MWPGGQPGGDGTPIVLDVEANALRDISNNLVRAHMGVAVTELPDTIRPEVTSANLAAYLMDLSASVVKVRARAL